MNNYIYKKRDKEKYKVFKCLGRKKKPVRMKERERENVKCM